jgi:ferredoxin
MGFDDTAEFYIRNGWAREVNLSAALGILKQAEAEGLVVQASNSRDAMFLCTCCGCCCAVLTSVKRYAKPASIVHSAFRAALDVEACDNCGICETRCQMEAIAVDNGHAVLDLDRCIGCGLCVTTCPSEALSLTRKPDAIQPSVPKDFQETVVHLGQTRGKLDTPGLIGMVVRSKIDRLLAPRA